MHRLLLNSVLLLFISFGSLLSASSPLSYSVSRKATTGITVTVTNHHSSPVTALLVETRQYTPDGRLRAVHATYQDVYVNLNHDQPLPPSSSRTIPLFVPEALKAGTFDVKVTAALFEDGTEFGTERGIQILAGRRIRLALDIADVIHLLERSGSDRAALEQQLTQRITVAKRFKGSSETDHAIGTISALALVYVQNELAARSAACSSSTCDSENAEAVMRYLRQWQSRIENARR